MEKYIFHKIKQVKPLNAYILEIEFLSGECKLYDVSRLFAKYDDFKALIFMPKLFESVRVSQSGYGVEWSDRLDLSCNELYYNGQDMNECIKEA